jgi:hypothetical protein
VGVCPFADAGVCATALLNIRATHAAACKSLNLTFVSPSLVQTFALQKILFADSFQYGQTGPEVPLGRTEGKGSPQYIVHTASIFLI